MRVIVFLFLVPISFIHSQNTETIYDHDHSFGTGLSNTGSLFYNLFSDSTTSPSYYLDYKKKIDSVLRLRISFISKLNYNQNKSTLEFNDFFISSGLEKTHSLNSIDKLLWYYGADLYYKMNLKRYQIIRGSATSWNASHFGFGTIAFSGFEYKIHQNLTLNSELNIGVGLHQDFSNNIIGNNLAVWTPKLVSTRIFSLGIRGYFNAPKLKN